MKKLLIVLAATLLSLPAYAVKTGDPAPAFTGTTSTGKTVSLSDAAGKYLVLEWHNQGCPFVKKHYESGNMERLQKEWTGKGVVWWSIISSAEGKEGFVNAKDEAKYLARTKAAPSAVIFDAKGDIGHLYSAKTTPHMFVIDPQGKIIYQGAIDSIASTEQKDIKGSTNYVAQALTEAMAGKPVSESTTQPYGCSVKY